VSESPLGPYQKVQTILPPFAHDANIIRAPTGEFVLFVTALEGVKPKDCRHKNNNNNTTNHQQTTALGNHGGDERFVERRRKRRRHLRAGENHKTESSNPNYDDDDDDDEKVKPKDTYMLWAPEPSGPWSEPVMVLNSTIYNSDYWKKYNKTARCDSNLNGIILPSTNDDDDNKSDTAQPFFGLWRRCETEDLLTIPHALVASDWRNASTYKPIVDHPLFVLAGSGAEDPSNVWTTRTSDLAPNKVAYHSIFHDEQATRCMLGSCGGQGRHAVSLDGTTWRYSSVNAYERHFAWKNEPPSTTNTNIAPAANPTTNSTDSVAKQTVVRADTRARPHIVLAANGGDPHQQTPIALSTGLKETDESGYVYTLVQPLGGGGH
jgi:hypothetical protein